MARADAGARGHKATTVRGARRQRLAMTVSSMLSVAVAAVLLLLPSASPRPAAPDMGLLKSHAADGLGLGLGNGRSGLALPFVGQDDDDLPLVGKRAIQALGLLGPAANLVARQDGQDDADYSSRYDEYPMIVPRMAPEKRSAIMLDRLLGTLEKAVNGAAPSRDGLKAIAPDDRVMDLHRRGGNSKGRVYWRCYFNAVACYRRRK